MRSKYYTEIDGLRAIAVVGVILYHLNSLLVPGGFAGVDVFFVISGFVVSASIANLERKSTLSFLVDFYSRRALSEVPPLSGRGIFESRRVRLVA